MIINIDRKIQAWKAEYRIDGNSLGFYRMMFCGWFMLFGPPSYYWIGDVPKAFFNPPPLSIASLFDTFPHHSFFLFLDAVIAISLVLVALGFLTRVSTGALLIATLVGNNFQYSFGKIDHSIFIQCVLLVMLFVNWGQSLSMDQIIFKRRAHCIPSVWILAVFLAFGFYSAGFGKAVSWIDLDLETNGFLSWLYSGYYTLDRQELLAPMAIKVRPLWIWEFADISAVVFELGFIVALIRRRWFMTWLLVACIFHLINCLILNISFSSYSICYLAFVPWSKLIPKLKTLDRIPSWGLLAVFALMILVGPPFNVPRFLSSSSWSLERAALMWFASGVILALTLWQSRARRDEPAPMLL